MTYSPALRARKRRCLSRPISRTRSFRSDLMAASISASLSSSAGVRWLGISAPRECGAEAPLLLVKPERFIAAGYGAFVKKCLPGKTAPIVNNRVRRAISACGVAHKRSCVRVVSVSARVSAAHYNFFASSKTKDIFHLWSPLWPEGRPLKGGQVGADVCDHIGGGADGILVTHCGIASEVGFSGCEHFVEPLFHVGSPWLMPPYNAISRYVSNAKLRDSENSFGGDT